MILLGVLGMSIEDATAAFAEMCVTLFPNEGYDPESRSAKLEEVSKELLSKRGLSYVTRLRGETKLATQCKVCVLLTKWFNNFISFTSSSVCYMSAINLGPCLMLRNYASRHAAYNPTIVEAIRIAWATPGIFSSVHIGPTFMKEEFVSAVNGTNNPTFEAIKEVNEVFGGQSRISCLLSLGAGKLINLSANAENMLEQTAQDTEGTARELQMCLEKLGVYFRFSVDRGLESHHSQLGLVVSHTSVYLNDSAVSQKLEECVDALKYLNGVALEQLCMYTFSSLQCL